MTTEKLKALEEAYKDTIWMARRYAAGRSTHAPSTVDRHIENVEKVCGIKIEPDHTIVGDAGITINDQHPEYTSSITAAIVVKANQIFVEFEDYNNYYTCDEENIGESERAIAIFEVWEGDLNCRIWSDINRESPTHSINLESAGVANRKDYKNE
jgi:sarcosine oxidase delta subunit